MAMCLIWAPENEMNCFLVLIIFFMIRVFYFDIAIKIMVGLYIAFDVLILIYNQGELSTAFLHTTGAVLGLIVGIVMLKTKQVDCENWDIFSVWSGRHQMTENERAKLDAQTPKAQKERTEQEKVRQEKQLAQKEKMLEEIRWAIQEGNPLPALAIYRKTAHEFSGWTIPEFDWLSLIKLLLDKKHWSESVTAMQEYLVSYASSPKSPLVRLKLAQIQLVTQKKPVMTLRILEQIDVTALDAKQIELFHKIQQQAHQMVSTETDGPETYELADE